MIAPRRCSSAIWRVISLGLGLTLIWSRAEFGEPSGIRLQRAPGFDLELEIVAAEHLGQESPLERLDEGPRPFLRVRDRLDAPRLSRSMRAGESETRERLTLLSAPASLRTAPRSRHRQILARAGLDFEARGYSSGNLALSFLISDSSRATFFGMPEAVHS